MWAQPEPVAYTGLNVPGVHGAKFQSFGKLPAQDQNRPGSALYVGHWPGHNGVFNYQGGTTTTVIRGTLPLDAISLCDDLAGYVVGDPNKSTEVRLQPLGRPAIALGVSEPIPPNPSLNPDCSTRRFTGFSLTASDGSYVYFLAGLRSRGPSQCHPIYTGAIERGNAHTQTVPFVVFPLGAYGSFGFDAYTTDVALGNNSSVTERLAGHSPTTVARATITQLPNTSCNSTAVPFASFFQNTKVPVAGPTTSGGTTVFFGSGSGREGIFVESSIGLCAVADLTTPIPDGQGAFSTFSEQTSSFGQVIAFVGGDGGSQGGIYARIDDGTRWYLVRVVDRSQALPPLGKIPEEFHIGRDALCGNRVLFWAGFSGGDEGVYLADVPHCPTPLGIDISYRALLNQCPECPTYDVSLRDVKIVSCVGVNTVGSDVPHVWYARRSFWNWGRFPLTYAVAPGRLVSGNAHEGTWEFTLQSRLVGGFRAWDRVFYFVVAKDLAHPGTVVSSPPGGSSGSMPPPTVNSFRIRGDFFCWVKNHLRC